MSLVIVELSDTCLAKAFSQSSFLFKYINNQLFVRESTLRVSSSKSPKANI
uniref:Uncharacterized protein n=1 Tax=Arion vulgaris TaxID=1028688 RepID=A0A0B7BRK1_9EUPU